MFYSPHPPELVTLSRVASPHGGNTPETQSPLSSTPNSPREQGDSEQQREKIVALPHALSLLNQRLNSSEAPFDESGTNFGSSDEKKVDGDELMGRQPQLFLPKTFEAVEDDDEHSQPPSLACVSPSRQDDQQPSSSIDYSTPISLRSPPPVNKHVMAFESPTQWEVPEDEIRHTLSSPLKQTEVTPNSPSPIPPVDFEESNLPIPMESLHLDPEPIEADESTVPVSSPEEEAFISENTTSNELASLSTKPVSLEVRSVSEPLNTEPTPALPIDSVLPLQDFESGDRPNPMKQRSQSEDKVSSALAVAGWNKYLIPSTTTANSDPGTDSTDTAIEISQWLKASKVTPKKDLQTSEKSAAWLQEEFKRRSVVKKEINEAILARSRHGSTDGDLIPDEMDEDDEGDEGDFNELDDASVSNAENSAHSEDDEVAALTAPSEYLTGQEIIQKFLPASQGGRLPVAEDEDTGTPHPRRLDYGDLMDGRYSVPPLGLSTKPVEVHELDSSTIQHASSDEYPRGRTNPMGKRVTEVLASPDVLQRKIVEKSFPESHIQEMLQFADDTRAALRDPSPGQARYNEGDDAPISIIATDKSEPHLETKDRLETVETPAHFRSLDEAVTVPLSGTEAIPRPTRVHKSASKGSEGGVTVGSESTGMIDPSMPPELVQSMDSIYGIAKGDITLSLLNESSGQPPNSRTATWASRVHGAIWRCRRMRRSVGESTSMAEYATGVSRGRSSLPVDLDKARVSGGAKNVQSTLRVALEHLKHDEINDAMELFEDIIFAYYAYFEQSLKQQEENPGKFVGQATDFKPYIGVALHNLGILKLLNGDYNEALSYFGRALENRKACLGEGHPDHVSSLVKLATCHYALNEFAEAHAKLEEALVFARNSALEVQDKMQMAEILNNLGCLAYMCGQPMTAKAFYRESLDVQFDVLSESLYVSTAAIGQSISLNISITRANIGFVMLVTKDLGVAVTALENALMEQQILLSGANPSLIATMDHLAVANLLLGESRKAAMMFGRILELQQQEYGPQDRRCYITMDKINMVRSQGANFEQAVEELRRIFTLPVNAQQRMVQSPDASDGGKSVVSKVDTTASTISTPQDSSSKNKSSKRSMMKVLTSMRKKK